MPQAVETAEGLAKGAYSRLFDWIVDRLNVCVAPTADKKNFIGVLGRGSSAILPTAFSFVWRIPLGGAHGGEK